MKKDGLNYIKGGDITLPILTPNNTNIILHVVNDLGLMGKGVAKAISKKWPTVREEYEEHFLFHSDRKIPVGGTVNRVSVANNLMVYNLFAQTGIYPGAGGKAPIRYTWLETCFNIVQEDIDDAYVDTTIHVPYLMGCDLAGGDWEIVSGLLTKKFHLCEVKVYDINCKWGGYSECSEVPSTQHQEGELIWGCEDGRRLPLSRIEDLHLANIYYHVRNVYSYPKDIILKIKSEVEKRGLSHEFLNGAPYPFFDMVDKVWKKWDSKKNSSVKI